MRKIFIAAGLLFSGVALMAQTSQKKDSMHVLLNEVTVTSIRAHEKSAVSYSDVSNEEIEKRNFGQDIPYLLSLTPSFVATSDAGTGIGYSGFRVRGTDANRINVTVNSVPLNDAESHGVFFVNMPDFASSLSSVQVQRGVGTSTNGAAAFGASMNMQTEGLNPKAYAELSTSIGAFNTNKNMLKAGTGLINQQWSFDARLSNVSSDGYIDRAWVDMSSYYFSGGYFGEKSTLKFVTFGGKEKTYQAWNGVTSDSLLTNRTYNEIGAYTDADGKKKFYDNQTDNYNQTHYQLHWNQEILPELYFNASAHYTRGIGYYEEYKGDRYYSEYGLTPDTINGSAQATSDLVRRKWLDNHFGGIIWALNYQKENINASLGGGLNRYVGEHFGKVIWVRNAQNLDVDHEWYRSHSVKDDANIYAKLNVGILDDLYVSADLQYRYVHHTMSGLNDKFNWNTMSMRPLDINKPFHFFNPKLGVTYLLADNQNVYASFSVANREPNRNNYTDAGENDQPLSERLYDTELGYRFGTKTFSAGINAYYMKYKHQLVLTGKISEIGEALTSNVDDSYRTGIELMAGWQILKSFKWDGNLSLSRNKIINYTDVAYIYDEDYNITGQINTEHKSTNIAYSPGLVANSVFTYRLKNFEMGFYSQFVGKQYLDNTTSDERSMDAYFVNNLSLQYSLLLKNIRSIDFKLMINNLFNEVYETNGYAWSEYYQGDTTRYSYKYLFPQAGINLMAGVTVKF